MSFKQLHFKQDVILMLIRWYVAYALGFVAKAFVSDNRIYSGRAYAASP